MKQWMVLEDGQLRPSTAEEVEWLLTAEGQAEFEDRRVIREARRAQAVREQRLEQRYRRASDAFALAVLLAVWAFAGAVAWRLL
jgi:hypothetical protein